MAAAADRSDGALQERHDPPSLPFHRVGLVGRDGEVRRLLGLIARSPLDDTGPTRTLVLLSGHSGSGKSAIVERVRRTVAERWGSAGGCFVSGKCELSDVEEGTPYDGIRQAVDELCRQIDPPYPSPSSSPTTSGVALRDVLVDRLSQNQLRLLASIVPRFASFLQPRHRRAEPQSSDSRTATPPTTPSTVEIAVGAATEFKEHTNKLKYTLRRFMQIVCEHCRVVLAVDDLQWADYASLDLLRTWLLDSKNTGLTVIGSYRSNMLQHNQWLTSKLVALENVKRERSIRIVELTIGDLRIDDVALYLSRLLSVEPSPTHSQPDIRELASVVHSTTQGNPFFIRQFVQSLADHGLLSARTTDTEPYSEQTQWSWDVDAINRHCATATDTVAGLMKLKLDRNDAARIVLPIAACIGTTFSVSHVSNVIRGLSIHSEHSRFFHRIFNVPKFLSDTDVALMMAECSRECFVELTTASTDSGDDSSQATSPSQNNNERNTAVREQKSKREKKTRGTHTRFCFAHDKVQEAALALIPTESDRSELKYRIGETLMLSLPKAQLDDMIFVVTNLLSAKLDIAKSNGSADRRLKMANLNYRAGLQAAGCSAFHQSTAYFASAIELLPDDHWRTCFRQSIDMYSSAAESAFVASDHNKARLYCSTIIGLDCDILHKVRAYHVLIDVCSSEAKEYQGMSALDLCLDLSSQLGCKLPTSPVRRALSTIKALIFAKRLATKLDSKFLDSLPRSDDSLHLAVLKTLHKATMLSYVTRPDVLPMIVLKRIRRSLKHGATPDTAVAFGFQGTIIQIVLGDFGSSMKYSRASIDLARTFGDSVINGKALLQFNTMLRHWTEPLEGYTESFLKTYHIGMTGGDVETGQWSSTMYLLASFIVGKPLTFLDDEYSIYAEVAHDFQQYPQFHLMSVLWQAVLNLRGSSDHTIRLIGDAYDERVEIYEPGNEMKDLQDLAVEGGRLILCAIFGEYSVGASIAAEYVSIWCEKIMGNCSLPYYLFHGGLCCFVSAREQNDRNIRRIGLACLRKLKEWNKKGHPNCPHYIALLEAECSWHKSGVSAAHSLYRKSIELAKSRGFVHDEALASERYSHLWASQGDECQSKRYMDKAVELYGKWGADRKVEFLLRSWSPDGKAATITSLESN